MHDVCVCFVLIEHKTAANFDCVVPRTSYTYHRVSARVERNISTVQLDHLFTYIPPTHKTLPYSPESVVVVVVAARTNYILMAA